MYAPRYSLFIDPETTPLNDETPPKWGKLNTGVLLLTGHYRMTVLDSSSMRQSLFAASRRAIFMSHLHLTFAGVGYADMFMSVLIIFVVNEMLVSVRTNLEVFVCFGNTVGDSFRFCVISSRCSTSRRNLGVSVRLVITSGTD